jgi:hypothetical protein
MVLSTSLLAAPVSADGKPWYSVLDSERLEHGLGFLRKFKQPGICKETVDELAGAMTSMSPETWGAAIGLAVGAAAGVATTRSLTGAVRGGIVMGSIGSALGHLADVLVPERMAALADNLQDLVQERDGKVCELLRASDKLRAPVLEHLHASLARECQLDPESVSASQSGAGAHQAKQLGRCLRENPKAERIVDNHVSVLTTINRGTCKVAAAIVERFDRALGETGAQRAADVLVPACADPADERVDDTGARDHIL